MAEMVSNARLNVAPPSSESVPAKKEEGAAVRVVAESNSEGRTWSWGQIRQGAKYAAIGVGGATVLYYGASPLWETAKKIPGTIKLTHHIVTEGIPTAVNSISKGIDASMGCYYTIGRGLAQVRKAMSYVVPTPPVPTTVSGFVQLGTDLVHNSWILAGALAANILYAGALWKLTKPLVKGADQIAAATVLTGLVVETAAPDALVDHPVKTIAVTAAGIGTTWGVYWTLSKVVALAATGFIALKTRLGYAAPAPKPQMVQVTIDAVVAEAIVGVLQRIIPAAAPGAAGV